MLPGGASAYLDVGINNPAAPSNVDRGSVKVGAVAQSMVVDKKRDFLHREGLDPADLFFPLIFDAFGAVHEEVKDAVGLLFADVQERLGWAAAQLFHRVWRRRTSDAVQRGMAWVLAQGLHALRHRAKIRPRRRQRSGPAGPPS